jgi:hypothetical protein
MNTRMIFDGIFGGRFHDRQHAIDIFNRYNAEVQRRVPPERLLVFDVKSGWEPLCAFLGVPVPQGVPFPHLNDTAEFRRRIHIIRTIAYGLPVAVATLALGAILALRFRRNC